MFKSKITKVLLAVTIGILVSASGFLVFKKFGLSKEPTNYDECAKRKDSAILLSYPEVCLSKEGKRFVKPVSESERKNLIPPSPQALTATPSPKPVKIPVLSTSTWKQVSLEGISFKIPENASCNNDSLCSLVTYNWSYAGRQLQASIPIGVGQYTGGSRREIFLKSNSEVSQCRPLFVEGLFGKVSALQIAIDGGWCQGNSGGIIAVIGNKIVIFTGGLSYDPTTKIINRWDIRDTVISTLKPF